MMSRPLLLFILMACPIATAFGQGTPFVGNVSVEYKHGVSSPMRMMLRNDAGGIVRRVGQLRKKLGSAGELRSSPGGDCSASATAGNIK